MRRIVDRVVDLRVATDNRLQDNTVSLPRDHMVLRHQDSMEVNHNMASLLQVNTVVSRNTDSNPLKDNTLANNLLKDNIPVNKDLMVLLLQQDKVNIQVNTNMARVLLFLLDIKLRYPFSLVWIMGRE
jgi:hypothetical protein